MSYTPWKDAPCSTRRIKGDFYLLRVDFDRRLKLKFHGSKIILDADFLACWELDDTLGVVEVFEDGCRQWYRQVKMERHNGAVLQSAFGRHVCCLTFQLAEGAVPRNLFQKTLTLINDLR